MAPFLFTAGKSNVEISSCARDLLVRKRRLGEKRRGKLHLDRIFTTGLPQEGANRYYSS